METPAPKSDRLLSLDALRGFDLFWIIGGHALAAALFKLTEWGWLGTAVGQMQHAAWHGFKAYDLIFPLFLFLAGVSTPFALQRRLAAGERRAVILKVVRRGMILVLLGVIYNNGLQWRPLEEVRLGSVLGRIGLSCMIAQLIFVSCHTRPHRLWAWLVGILLGYWAVMGLGHAPGYAAGDLTMEGNFASYVDRLFLPGRLHLKIHDPEGLLAVIPAVGNALLGILAGLWLRRPESECSGDRKAGGLVALGLLLLALGAAWDFAFPINKNLWTSSFVLWTCGWAQLLLGLFYWIIDVRGFRRWGDFFAVIGMNSVLIYMAGRFISFSFTSQALFGGIAKLAAPGWQPVIAAAGVLAVEWLFLWFLRRHKVFLSV